MTGCGDCVATCPADALGTVQGRANLVHPDRCTYCNACEDICPVGAIVLPYHIVSKINNEVSDHETTDQHPARQRINTQRQRIVNPLKLLSVLTVFGFGLGLYLALVHAPTDGVQGEVQRIFYLHLASFAGAFVGFSSTVVGGVVYLKTRSARWDMLAHAGVEVGLLLAAINVMTGAIYARPIVNSWWTWDPKLTAIAIMVLTYISYLMLRNGVESPDARRVFASVYGIVAFVTVVYTFAVIRLRSDVLHDVMLGPGAGLLAMPAPMQTALLVNILIWAGLTAPVLMAWRIRLEQLLQNNERLRLNLLEN